MTAVDLGRWEPASLGEVVGLFDGAPFRWWVSGGHALELHLGRSWREHGDVDVGMLRRDVRSLPDVLDGWDLRVASQGRLLPWTDRPLDREAHENNVWCRAVAGGPWRIDLVLSDGDQAAWAYRPDPGLRRPWPAAVLRSTEGVPYLAPDLQLLFKSRSPRPKDDLDAAEVVPELDAEQGQFLAGRLPRCHPWRSLLAAAGA